MSGAGTGQTAGPTRSTQAPTEAAAARPDAVELQTRVIPAGQGPEAEAPFEVGTTPEDWAGRRLDRYLVIEQIGRGGMGDVLLAYDPELDRRVAIKLIRPRKDAGDAADEQSRLLREAQALAKLSHPNVVAVHDVGTAEGRIYVAMEYVQGATLSQWCASPRAWRETTAVVGAAARGLAAAHREGIVHRDFKPGNVMVGDDGRVRVLDFGLARHVGPPSGVGADAKRSSGDSWDILSSREGIDPLGDAIAEPLSESFRSLDQPLTETGTVMGTPAYMAPEQFRGDGVDARTDQFALCVVLYEALYGERPFTGKNARALAKAVLRGKVRKPDRGRGVPHRVEAAILRGLSPDPDDRHAELSELLAELDRAARPTRWLPVVLTAVGVAALGVAATTIGGGPPPCRGAEQQLDSTWGPGPRAALAEAFTRTGLPYADASAKRVSAVLSRYAEQWIDAHTQACEATRVSGEQSEALMDLRIRCLSLRRGELAALVGHLTSGELKAVENAVAAATRLPPISACEDAAFLSAAVTPPTDPDVAAKVAEAQAKLADARARSAAGDWVGAVPPAMEVLQLARTLDVAALTAESGLVVGVGMDRGGDSEAAHPIYIEALGAAAEAGHTRAEAMILSALVGNIGYFGSDLDTAKDYAAHAHGVLARLGHPPILEGQLALNEANMLMRGGKYDEAEPLYQHVLQLVGDADPALMVRLAALTNLAALYGTQAQMARAAETGALAQATMESELGPEHPAVGIGLNNLGATMMRMGDEAAAAAHLRRSEAILSAAFPAGHPELSKALHNYGQLLAHSGDTERAEATYRRALTMKRNLLGEGHPSVAHTLNNLGTLLHTTRPKVAREYLERALEVWTNALGADHPHNAYALGSLADLALLEGDVDSAIASARRALRLRIDAGHGGEDRAIVRFSLAKALAARPDDDGREAQSMARLALADAKADVAPDPEHIAEIEAWLAR